MTIGQRVKAVRKERGLSQVELSKKLGIDQSLISYLESGKGTGSSHIASLAHVLKVNAHWLETGQGSPKLDYVQPVAVEKSYCKEIHEAIKLMESADNRGRLKMLIALQDAFEAHNAWKNSLPRPQNVKGDEVVAENASRLANKLTPEITKSEKATHASHLVQELMPEILERVKIMESEKMPNDVYKGNENARARKDKRH